MKVENLKCIRGSRRLRHKDKILQGVCVWLGLGLTKMTPDEVIRCHQKQQNTVNFKNCVSLPGMFQRNPKHQELDNSNGCLTKVCPQELEAYVISPNLGFPVTNFQIQDFRVYNYRRGRKEKKKEKKKKKTIIMLSLSDADNAVLGEGTHTNASTDQGVVILERCPTAALTSEVGSVPSVFKERAI